MAPQHCVCPITLEEKREKIPLSPEKMKALFEWENEQEVANFATDVELEAQVGSKGQRKAAAKTRKAEDVADEGVHSQECEGGSRQRVRIKTAVEKVMGPSELITLEPPVCNADGTWKGGLAFEHGAKPVKPDTCCYTLANLYQAPKETWSPAANETWSPAANAKINGTFNANNLLYQELIVAAAGFGKFATEQAPPDVYEDMKNHAAMLNIPALDCEGNFAYQTLQATLAPTAKFGSNDGLSKSIGTFGKMHQDTHDSASRIHFTLRNFDSLNFCGLNIHGGSPPVAPEGTEVTNDAYHVTLIAYPPAAMGDGLEHIAVAALPGSWDNGPGFRDPNATYEPSDGNNLVSQDTIWSHHKRLRRLHYNRLSWHIPYAVVHGMAYDIDAHGNLLEDMEVDDDLGTDALGNPIEKGGRPWKKPAAPVSQAKAARQEALKRAAKAAAALKATADGSPNGSGNHRSKRKKKTVTLANIDLAKTDTLGAIWTSEPYTTLQKDFLSANPRPGQLEGAEMNPADMNPMNVVRNLDDVNDFMEVTIDQQELDQAVFEASQHLSEVTPSYSPPHLELAFSGMRKDPIAIETCVHIFQAWGEIKDLYIYEAEATLVLKLDRHSIMQTTYTFWTWLDGYCVEIIKNAQEDIADCIIQNAMNNTIVSINWIA
ncbi:hypothetical protein C8R44DRAFT_727099 [Mycena epipterygia]|nr:hypothetical protein C8R44DRAFT_727099 [Mycena epipterygia]